MGKHRHRVLQHSEDQVECAHCGWVPKTVKAGIPKCSVARREQRGQKPHSKLRGTECDICGSTEQLCADHNHDCCPGKQSCGECFRGTLCNRCNVTEGFIRRARRDGTLDKLLAW